MLGVHPEVVASAIDTTDTAASVRQYPSVPRRNMLVEEDESFPLGPTSRKYTSLAMGVEMVVRKSNIDAVAITNNGPTNEDDRCS